MDEDVNQQQLLSNSPVHIADTTITEETPLTDQPPDGEQGIQSAIPENLEWTASILSQVKIYILFDF
jgi:hypothetical protein